MPYYLTDGSLLFLVRHVTNIQTQRRFLGPIHHYTIHHYTFHQYAVHPNIHHYTIHHYTMLLVRDCSFPGDDLDIAVDLTWWR